MIIRAASMEDAIRIFESMKQKEAENENVSRETSEEKEEVSEG